jgi:hypothetical protein
MQGIADSFDPENVQIISYNPGSVRSEAVLKSKWANAPIAWNTGKEAVHNSTGEHLLNPPYWSPRRMRELWAGLTFTVNQILYPVILRCGQLARKPGSYMAALCGATGMWMK